MALTNEPIERKHDRFLKGIANLPSPWGAAGIVLAPDPEAELVAILSASKFLGKGIKGHVVYQYRRYFRDEAAYDDWIDLTFNPSKIDYRALAYDFFPHYVEAFGGYMATISDDEFIYMDFEERRRLKMDARSSIYRIDPISYFSDSLCKRGFGLSAKQVMKRLTGKVEDVRLGCGGVFIVLTSAALPTLEMDNICWEAKAHLSR